MNLLPTISVYATLDTDAPSAVVPRRRPRGARGGRRTAAGGLLEWAGTSHRRATRSSVTNGDVFDWHDVCAPIAESLDMDIDRPKRSG